MAFRAIKGHCLLVALLAAFLSQSSIAAAQISESRSWLAPMNEIRRIEDVEGDLLGHPMFIQASPGGGFTLADWADNSVKSFSSNDELLWKFGRFGQGPGEFSDRIIDLEFDESRTLVVLDRSGRITVLDATGQLVHVEAIPITRHHPPTGHLFPRHYGDGDPVLLSPDYNYLWTSGGRSVPNPNIYNLDLSTITSHRGGVNAPDGEAVVFHTWSDQMILLDTLGRTRATVRGVERVEFPDPLPVIRDGQLIGYRANPQAIVATQSVVVGDDCIYVLFQGASEHRGRVIDTYSRAGEYLGSHLLSGDLRAEKMAVLANEEVAVIDNSFIPTIIFYRRSP